jgi:hypothetical protein
MTTPALARFALASTCAAALLLAGCSGGGDDGDKGGDKGAAAFEWTPGPLDEYSARIYGYSYDQDEKTQEELQAESDAKNRKVEELVATCMQDQGFDYTPNDTNGGTVFASDDLDVEWGSREFAEQYGYGISTDPWGSTEQPVDDGSEYVDPNAEYTEAMSESELAAYQEALWGVPQEYVEGEEPVEYDWTTAGCYGAAQHEVYEIGGTDTDEFSALEDEISAFWETVQADPRISELNASWGSCMADAGFDGLTSANDSTQPLYDEWNQLQGYDDPDYQAQVESWDWEADPNGPKQPEPDADAVAAFTKKEIAMAVADFDCKDEVDFQEESQRIDHELQQQFVDQNKAELEAWATAAESSRDA